MVGPNETLNQLLDFRQLPVACPFAEHKTEFTWK